MKSVAVHRQPLMADDSAALPTTDAHLSWPRRWASAYRRAIEAQLGRRPFIVLFGAGGLSILSMAPFHFWPVLFFTLPVFFWAVDSDQINAGRNLRAALWRGWAFGFGYQLAGLYWIGFSFLVQAERFAALMPFAILALTASLGLFFGFAGVLFRSIRGRVPSGLPRIALLALVIMVAEWLRGHIFTGFPWNILGYALTMPLPLMQWTGLFGIYVLTAVTVITLASPVILLAAPVQPRPLRQILMTTVVPLTLALIYGLWQLSANPTVLNKDVRLRLVQPAFSQREKFDPQMRGPIFRRHLELSAEGFSETAGSQEGSKPTHVIWPEAAIPFFVRRDKSALRAIADALPDHVQVIAGTFRINASPEVPNEAVVSYRVFNSALTIGGDGQVKSIYDKIHLVPFGEYLPAQKMLNALGFENLTRTSGGLEPGRGPRRLMRIDGLPPVAMLICYEASFPQDVVQGAERPGLLINLTNDAWFGTTTGPYQHLHQTRLRAVEQGLPMLRSANTGVSAIVDPVGRLLASLPLNATGVIDSSLPKAVRTPIYARAGWIIESLFAIALVLSILTSMLGSGAVKQKPRLHS